jgi:hypothetical protein
MKALVSNASTQTMLFAGRCIHRKLVAFDSVGRMFTAGFLGLMASRPYRTSYTVRFVTLLSLWKLPKSTMVALNPLQAPKASSLSDSTLFEGASNRTMSRLLFWAARRNGVIRSTFDVFPLEEAFDDIKMSRFCRYVQWCHAIQQTCIDISFSTKQQADDFDCPLFACVMQGRPAAVTLRHDVCTMRKEQLDYIVSSMRNGKMDSGLSPSLDSIYARPW